MRVLRVFDPWKNPLCTCPRKLVLHPYTGCSHFCLYCYATSYIGRRPSTPKKGFLKSLIKDLSKPLDDYPFVELSTSSDPYPPEESMYLLTRKTIELLASRKINILITTKSNLVVRDIELLRQTNSAVMITITTLDESIAKIIEPGAPSPRDRLEVIEKLSEAGIPVGARIDPIIPFVNDDEASLRELVNNVIEAGGRHIVTSTYKAKPDSFRRLATAFPELHTKLRELYYEKGVLVHGYRYLPRDLRRRILHSVIDEAVKKGISAAVCREGLPELFKAPSCDGSHMLWSTKR